MIFLCLYNKFKPRSLDVYARTFFSTKRTDTQTKKSKKYSSTLNLPKTEFPISMHDAANREIDIHSLCSFSSLYQWQRENNTGKEFILHDGPPYANGRPHVGHAINKILKDIINRYHILRGRCVHYVPGWDCHGLPIELKALQDRTDQKLTPLQIRDQAKKFAEGAIKLQMSSFQRWGVVADWDTPYYTFNPRYEVCQLDVFFDMYKKGLIYRDVMPVYWSPSSRTALAESELVYNPDHMSTAIYVGMPVAHMSESISQFTGSNKKLYAVIWTTTPWSIPANQAICFSTSIRYSLLEDQLSGDMYLCEDSFVDKMISIIDKPLTSVASFNGDIFEGMTYHHPLSNKELKFIASSHVKSNMGTGLVHNAPEHGHVDFQIAKNHGIHSQLFVNDACCYTAAAGSELQGKSVTEAEQTILDLLGNKVLHKEYCHHSYPYDWRSNKPVIIRASKQWFIDTKKLKDKAIEALKSVKVVPALSENGMLKQLESRTYWCISRQRVWGVPIPVFYNKCTMEPLLNSQTLGHIRELISVHGSDCWWSMTNEELLPTRLLQQLGIGRSEDYIRGQDILDIWFDSGSSWASVLGVGKQADIYIEGPDQFGGWFLSSLLISVAVQNMAPYKSLIVHGFTVDEDGRKMSKSLGNVIDPDIVTTGGKNKKTEPAYGADVLRWWAAFSGLQPHSTIGTSKLQRMQQDIYELRKTLRFLLGNVSVAGSRDLVEYDSLWPQDQYMLYQLFQLGSKITELYDNIQYTKILQMVDKFCKDEVSKFYLSIVKDRCYCERVDSLSRQASLTTQFYILDVVTRALAPILPYMTEELHLHYPPNRRKSDSLFKTGWFDLPEHWNNSTILHKFQPALHIREHLQDILISEPSIEFDVMIYASNLLHSKLHDLQAEHTSSHSPLCEILQTASTTLSNQPLTVIPDNVQAVNGICHVHMKDGFKCQEKYVLILKDTDRFLCERCRKFSSNALNELCSRCMEAI